MKLNNWVCVLWSFSFIWKLKTPAKIKKIRGFSFSGLRFGVNLKGARSIVQKDSFQFNGKIW